MTKERFQTWIPANNLGSAYDVEAITWSDRLSLTLAADEKRTAQNNIHHFQLTWDLSHVISYNVTDETYRADCWGLDFEHNGRFYTSIHSDYIDTFRQKSPLFPDHAIHFLIVGTNTIVDVLAKAYPTVFVFESPNSG